MGSSCSFSRKNLNNIKTDIRESVRQRLKNNVK